MKTIACTIDGRAVPVKNFIAMIKKAKKFPENDFSRSFKNWFPTKGKNILSEYHEIIMENINRRGGLVVRELKNETWFIRAKMLLNGNFVVRKNDLPPRIRNRFSERILSE